MLGGVTFVTRYGDVVERQSKHFVGVRVDDYKLKCRVTLRKYVL